MKRLLFVVALVLLPTALFAGVEVDRDVLLTADGTLYTIESEYRENYPQLHMAATQFLMLTVQSGTKVSQTIVPESQSEGLHRRPALAYDPDSKTVFVFWLKAPNAMSNELLVASYKDGRWRSATSIDDKPYTYRENLRIAVTRHVPQLQHDGSTVDIPMLVVHAVWWEVTGYGETARYAMLPVDHEAILLTNPSEQIHDLTEFVSPGAPYSVPPSFNAEVLRHPAILDTTAAADGIDVVFGETKTNSFNRTHLRPIISDGRLRIPVGVTKGGARPQRFAPPTDFTAQWTGRVDSVTAAHSDNDRLAMYNVDAKAVSYIVYRDGKWSAVNSLPISEKLSSDAAVRVLSRMVSENQ